MVGNKSTKTVVPVVLLIVGYKENVRQRTYLTFLYQPLERKTSKVL